MGFDPNAQNNYPNYQGSPFQQNPSGYQQYPGYPGAPAVGYRAGAAPYAIDVAVVMRQVYLWLALGLAIGFGIAFAIGHVVEQEITAYQNGADISVLRTASLLFNPVVGIIALIAYFGLAFALPPVIDRASVPLSATLYIVFTAVFGFLISSLFLEYQAGTIWAAFAATAGMFAVLSLIGYTTKLDLSKFGAILFMALIGLIIASVVNFFLKNDAIYWIVSYLGVVIFAGLTAYNTQAIKRRAAAVALDGKTDGEARVALYGAFTLFLTFVNLFLFILRILGGGRGRG
jgi:FtsH-binding integral membrane protein